MSMLLLANVILKRRCVRTSCLQWMPELQWIRCSLKSKVKNFKCELNLFYFKIQSKYTYILYYKCYFLSFFFLFFHIVKLWTNLKLWTTLKWSTTHWVDSIDESFMFCMNWIQMTKENDWRFKVKIFSIGKFSLLLILYLHGAAVFTKAKFKGNENSFEIFQETIYNKN